jgi:hypothetical protein
MSLSWSGAGRGRGAALIALAIGTAGCAGTNVSRISNPDYGVGGKYSDDQADGIRYYESAPFLLVYSDGKGGVVSKLLFLPDLTRKRVIDPYATLSSNNSTLTFTNGVLTQGKTVVDETVFPKAVVGALEKVASAIVMGAFNAPGAPPTAQLPPPQLFKIVLLPHGQARLLGGQTVDKDGKVKMIDVTISKPDEAEEKAAPAGQEKKPTPPPGQPPQPPQAEGAKS